MNYQQEEVIHSTKRRIRKGRVQTSITHEINKILEDRVKFNKSNSLRENTKNKVIISSIRYFYSCDLPENYLFKITREKKKNISPNLDTKTKKYLEDIESHWTDKGVYVTPSLIIEAAILEYLKRK